VRYLPDKKNKIFASSPALASARIAPKICQSQLQIIYSEFPEFHLNPFSSGGVIAERVNISLKRATKYFQYSVKLLRRVKIVSGRVVAQSIAFRVHGINILQGVAPLPSHLNAKGPTRRKRVRCTHFASAQQPPTSATSLRSAHWLASDFHSWINSWTDCSSNCQIHTQTV